MDRLPKSILKKTQSSTAPQPTQPAKNAERSRASPERKEKHDRNMEIALMHARRIQQQKEFEKRILDDMFKLLDLPRASDADPASPSQDDVAEFKKLVGDFRPRDYEDLIEERSASGQCGYPLCPRPRRTFKGDAIYTLVFEKTGPRTVLKKELERFCSNDCTRRAMYIKVQLLDQGAIAGPGIRSQPIALLTESSNQTMSLPLRQKDANAMPPTLVDEAELEIQDSQIAAEQTAREQLAGLVLGTDRSSVEGNRLITAEIVEKGPTTAVVAPNLTSDSASWDLIEGHAVRRNPLHKAHDET